MLAFLEAVIRKNNLLACFIYDVKVHIDIKSNDDFLILKKFTILLTFIVITFIKFVFVVMLLAFPSTINKKKDIRSDIFSFTLFKIFLFYPPPKTVIFFYC